MDKQAIFKGNLKQRKAVGNILSYLIIIGVVASMLIYPYFPKIQKSIYNILNSTARQYNSQDTVMFDESGNPVD